MFCAREPNLTRGFVCSLHFCNIFVSSRPQVTCLRVRIPTIFPTRFPIPAQNPNFGWVHILSLLCEQPALPVGLGAYHSLSLRTLITL